MSLAERIKQAQTKQVFSVVCLETGGWLDHYDLYPDSEEFGNHRSRASCSVKTPGECHVVEKEELAFQIADACHNGHDRSLTFCVVTIHLPE